MIQQRILSGAGLLVTLLGPTGAFTTLAPSSLPGVGRRASSLAASSRRPDVVVISPPGGIGEITSVQTARLGGCVKWFVVSAPSPTTAGGRRPGAAASSVALKAETLAAISRAGGSMELAGASADDLLAPPDGGDANAALSALAAWCGDAGAFGSLVCTYDGTREEKRRADRTKTPQQLDEGANVDEEQIMRGGIRVAAREAARVARDAGRIAVLAAGDEMGSQKEEEEEGRDGEEGGLFAGLFGGKELQVPHSMAEAMGGGTSVIRHGELFGAPESSPESSPFMGGPKRDPIVREMYTMRSVRIDPTVSVSGNILSGGDGSKSNRLAIGEAASRLGLGRVPGARAAADVSLSSFPGTEPPTDAEWDAEFGRAAGAAAPSPAGGAPRLFRTEFSSVPSAARLADWVATKWAPAILRSYDIAGTRVGARPVYALRTGGDEGGTTIEIVWQELVDFESVTSGRMIIEVDGSGMTATRGPGDAGRGFGSISATPLPGEDILVRRLADAASQAVEKGLAVKPKLAKKESAAASKKRVTTVVVADVPPPAQPAPTSSAEASGPGPRGAGARRSAERSRGNRRRSKPRSPPRSDGGS